MGMRWSEREEEEEEEEEEGEDMMGERKKWLRIPCMKKE